MKNPFLLLCLIFFGTSSIYSQSLNIPLISINETETAYVEVDEIHFTVTVFSHAEEISDARQKNREISEAVFKYLDSKKIPKQYIQTKRMTVSRNYIRNRQPREYDGFNAYQQIYVCLKDIGAFDEILDQLLIMSVESVSGPIFKSSKYEEVLKETQLKALLKAKKSAKDMADVLGQNIGKAKLISNSVARANNSAYSSQPSNTSSQGGQSSFEIGEIEIVASVNVSFELLD
jgi:uncharacterized protein YggE